MTSEEFGVLLGKVKHLLTKQNTKMRLSIAPRERLSLTLRFLAKGEITRLIIIMINCFSVIILYLFFNSLFLMFR